MSIIFENPGIIDSRAITVAGINVKDESRQTIGFFGTGLKYAIAVLLRHGQGVTIHAGRQIYCFTAKPIQVREKDFQIICMNGQELGFTTEYGKTWELWMAYRELWSNCMDEGGRVYDGDELADVEACTQIVVDGGEFEGVHMTRGEFLLMDRQPVAKTEGLEIYVGTSEYIFYRGIRAGAVPAGKRSRFTYNITDSMTLTEDRTIASAWDANHKIREALLGLDNEPILISCLTEKDENVLENRVDYDTEYQKAGETFIRVVERLKKTRVMDLNDKALKKFNKQTKKEITPEGRLATPQEEAMIDIANAWLFRIGIVAARLYEVRVAESLGDGVLGIAVHQEKKIVLAARVFKDGVGAVARALLEEVTHLATGFPDASRRMQDHLFEEVMRLGKDVAGEVG